MNLRDIIITSFIMLNIVFLVLPLIKKWSRKEGQVVEPKGPKPERQYEMDWLRVFAIVILLYTHTGEMFTPGHWFLINAETSPLLEHIITWLHYWRMPLLLFISGAGTYFALGFRKPGKFLAERSKRLFIPLVFGMLVVVPPLIYFERIAKFTSFWDFYPTVFEFVPYPLGGSLSWHHLWFILYLGIYSMIALPFFLYLRSDKSSGFFDRLVRALSRKSGLLLPLLPLVLSQVILRPFFPHKTQGLDDWAYFVYYFLFFIYGFIAYCEPRIRDILLKQRRFNLAAATLSLGIMYLLFWVRFDNTILLVSWYQLYSLSTMFVAWLWVMALIGYGRKFLTFNTPLLKYANEAIYPFYILHMTALIFFGYYIIPGTMGIFTKFMLISTLSIISSLAVYYLFIRPIAPLRVFFGVKLVSKKKGDKTTITETKEPVAPSRPLEPAPVKVQR
ncbi:MAG: acyltransferase family protein [bacterium]|nr:acyltransferase family protein [bacterium]